MNEIAGSIEVSTLRGEPNEFTPTGTAADSSVISFTENLTSKPIYLIVKGR